MVNKKGGKSGKGGGGKGSGGNTRRPKQHNELLREPQLAPQDRVDAVRPFWESLSHQERVALLTIDVEALRDRTRLMTEALKQQQQQAQQPPPPVEEAADGTDLLTTETSYESILDEGTRRLVDKGTWKLWTWTQDSPTFYDADSFRTFITEKHIREDLRKFLPREDTKAPEKPAEAAFRQRMVALLQKVQQNNRQTQEESTPATGRSYKRRHGTGADGSTQGGRDANVELINIMLEAMEKEHECIYQSVLQPIVAYVSMVLPEASRETTGKGELAFEDLDKIAPEHAAIIVEWLTEKVDALSSKLKADPKEEDEPEEDEENMGDVDLWSIVDEGKALTVNSKWLQHLQDRLLGEEGHPRRARAGEDPHHNGLVLEWVYGSIVSTAEKARDGAKRMLGAWMPHATDAHHMLLKALEDYWLWEVRGRQAKDLMSEMLKSRLQAQQTKQVDDVPLPAKSAEPLALPAAALAGSDEAAAPVVLPPPGSEDSAAAAAASQQLPDAVVISMLRREALLTKAKLHHLLYEHLQQDKMVRSLKAQLRQGEPEFERLKRELDEVKHQHRGLDGTYRSAAEMERHRAQLADAAIEEQLEVQTAFREQGARLQAIYDKKQRAEYEMSKREIEIKQLQGWKGTVENLVDKFVEVLQAMGMYSPLPGSMLGSVATPSTAASAAPASAATSTTNEGVAAPGRNGAASDRASPPSASSGGTASAVADRLAAAAENGAVESSTGSAAADEETPPTSSPSAGRVDGARAPEQGHNGAAATTQDDGTLDGATAASLDASTAQADAAGPTASEPAADTASSDGSPAIAAARVDPGAPNADSDTAPVTNGTSPETAGSSPSQAGDAPSPAAEAAADPDVDSDVEPEVLPTPQQSMQLAKLRTHFHKDVRKQLYGDAEDKQFFEWLKQEVKVVEKRLEEARVALQHLEMQLINIACDDPGAVIGMQMALPILQERLDAKALEHAAERAKMAESEIIKMELEQQAREAAERERRLKAKQSKKDKARSEREKMAAEKAAEKAAEDEKRAEKSARQRLQDEAERQRRLQQLEELRKAEEEYMEQRRKELLSDANGYWRRRMDAEARVVGAADGDAATGVKKDELPLHISAQLQNGAGAGLNSVAASATEAAARQPEPQGQQEVVVAAPSSLSRDKQEAAGIAGNSAAPQPIASPSSPRDVPVESRPAAGDALPSSYREAEHHTAVNSSAAPQVDFATLRVDAAAPAPAVAASSGMPGQPPVPAPLSPYAPLRHQQQHPQQQQQQLQLQQQQQQQQQLAATVAPVAAESPIVSVKPSVPSSQQSPLQTTQLSGADAAVPSSRGSMASGASATAQTGTPASHVSLEAKHLAPSTPPPPPPPPPPPASELHRGLASPRAQPSPPSTLSVLASPAAPLPVAMPIPMPMPVPVPMPAAPSNVMVMHPGMVPGMPPAPHPPPPMQAQPANHMVQMMHQPPPPFAMMQGSRPAMPPMQHMAGMVPPAMVPVPGPPGGPVMTGARGPAPMPPQGVMPGMPSGPYGLPPGHPLAQHSGPNQLRGPAMHNGPQTMPHPMFVWAPGGVMHGHGGLMHMGQAPQLPPHDPAAWAGTQHAPPPHGVAMMMPHMQQPQQPPVAGDAGKPGSSSNSSSARSGCGSKPSTLLSVGAKPFVPSVMRSPPQPQMHAPHMPGTGTMQPGPFGAGPPLGNAHGHMAGPPVGVMLPHQQQPHQQHQQHQHQHQANQQQQQYPQHPMVAMYTPQQHVQQQHMQLQQRQNPHQHQHPPPVHAHNPMHSPMQQQARSPPARSSGSGSHSAGLGSSSTTPATGVTGALAGQSAAGVGSTGAGMPPPDTRLSQALQQPATGSGRPSEGALGKSTDAALTPQSYPEANGNSAAASHASTAAAVIAPEAAQQASLPGPLQRQPCAGSTGVGPEQASAAESLPASTASICDTSSSQHSAADKLLLQPSASAALAQKGSSEVLKASPGSHGGASHVTSGAGASSREDVAEGISPATPVPAAAVTNDSALSTAGSRPGSAAVMPTSTNVAPPARTAAAPPSTTAAAVHTPTGAPAASTPPAALGGHLHAQRSLGSLHEQAQPSSAGATAGGSYASNGSSPSMPLSKNGSWSSVLVGDGDSVPDCVSPTPAGGSSSTNLAALAAMGIPLQGTWKQKLQHNMPSQQQQQPQRSSGSMSGSRAGLASATSTPGAQTTPKGQQQQAAPVVVRRAGSRTGAMHMSEPSKPPQGRLVKLADGQLAFVPVAGKAAGAGADGIAAQIAAGQQQPLQLARGMLNRGTQNNCFLNVILQSLWHLSSFREPMLAQPLEVHTAKGSAPQDQRVMAAIWRVFQAMAQPPPPQQQGSADGQASASAAPSTSSVSPQELRDALVGQSSVHIDPSDMQDAGEVFGEVLSILHRADLGAPSGEVADLQLPARVKVRVADASGSVAFPAPSHAGEAAVPAPAPVPVSLVHQVFGLDVQQPCPSGDGDEAMSTPGSDFKRAGRGGHRKSNGSTPAAGATAGVAAPGTPGGPVPGSSGAVGVWQGPGLSAKRLREQGVQEVQQFTKFFHLVPAQGLRKALAALPSASFEELLAEVETRSAHHGQRAAQPQQPPSSALLRRPAVFTLAIVWESPQAPHDAIKGTVEALGCELELSEVFRMPNTSLSAASDGSGTPGGAAPPSAFRLRCVVCYLGHHYLVFALSEEIGQWLLLDDEEVALVGQWADVCRTMVARRLQPSLLFFEDRSAARAKFSP